MESVKDALTAADVEFEPGRSGLRRDVTSGMRPVAALLLALATLVTGVAEAGDEPVSDELTADEPTDTETAAGDEAEAVKADEADEADEAGACTVCVLVGACDGMELLPADEAATLALGTLEAVEAPEMETWMPLSDGTEAELEEANGGEAFVVWVLTV